MAAGRRVGLVYQPNATLALYRITKKNVLTFDPRDTDYSIPAGAVASKGVELDVAGDIALNVRLSLVYAYTDAAVTQGDSIIVQLVQRRMGQPGRRAQSQPPSALSLLILPATGHRSSVRLALASAQPWPAIPD